jgi:TolB-like protein/Tfp pilus assembly protein PilF
VSDERWPRVKALFQAAVELPVDERAAFLTAETGDDTTLRRDVESLLQADTAEPGFLDRLPVASDSDTWRGVTTSAEADGLMIGRRIGAYCVVREIGRGGMGAAYLAERADHAFEKQVAIKLIKRGMDTDAILQRFRHERQILANLNHPNVATLLDGGTTDDGLPFFVMEYVDGVPIDEFCDAHQLSIAERLRLFQAVCAAVEHAHARRVIHRDLKPSNILVTAGRVPKLLDFGIAKLLDPDPGHHLNTTLAGGAMTPQFASPEQLRDEPLGPESDVYALGVLLYQLIAGRPPYRLEGRTPREVERLVCDDTPPKPSAVLDEDASHARGERVESLRRRLAGDLDTIVMTALRKDPSQRYATAAALGSDIQRHVEGAPIAARADRLGARVVTFLRRKRARAIGIAAALAIAVGVTGLFATRISWALNGREQHGVPAAPIRSIAVLPLLNLSTDAAQEYFSDGLTDELITRVAQIRGLQVISRTSVVGYKHTSKKVPEIGAELHVDSIVEGTVERVRDRVRIRVQLIRAATDQHIWADSYDRKVEDVLQLENEVAQEIAQQIGQAIVEPDAKLTRSHVVPEEAHEQYLRGRYRWNERSESALRAAIVHFKKAIEVDPLYAEAYAGLADSYIMLENWGFLSPADTYPLAEAAARKALELDDRLAEAHTSLAYAEFLFDWDWSGAETRLRRALELNPNYSTAHHFYSVYLMAAGRHTEAQREIERARDLDPLSTAVSGVVSWIYYEGRSYGKAMEQCRRTIAMDPTYAPSRLDLGGVYMARGEFDKAIDEFSHAQTLAGDTPAIQSYLAQGYALSGDTKKARSILQRLLASTFVSPWELALIYDALGDKNQALTQLERAADQRASWVVIMAVDPRLDDLHGDPRFKQLLQRVHSPSR